MARKRYKLTGFARFFIVMLFLAPIAYLTAIYINEGEEGLEELYEEYLGDDDFIRTDDDGERDLKAENKALRDSIKVLNRQYKKLEKEYRQLEESVGN